MRFTVRSVSYSSSVLITFITTIIVVINWPARVLFYNSYPHQRTTFFYFTGMCNLVSVLMAYGSFRILLGIPFPRVRRELQIYPNKNLNKCTHCGIEIRFFGSISAESLHMDPVVPYGSRFTSVDCGSVPNEP